MSKKRKLPFMPRLDNRDFQSVLDDRLNNIKDLVEVNETKIENIETPSQLKTEHSDEIVVDTRVGNVDLLAHIVKNAFYYEFYYGSVFLGSESDEDGQGLDTNMMYIKDTNEPWNGDTFEPGPDRDFAFYNQLDNDNIIKNISLRFRTDEVNNGGLSLGDFQQQNFTVYSTTDLHLANGYSQSAFTNAVIVGSNLNVNSRKITNVTTPANDSDAATKGYVDSNIGTTNVTELHDSSGNTVVDASTGAATMSGTLNMNSNIINDFSRMENGAYIFNLPSDNRYLRMATDGSGTPIWQFGSGQNFSSSDSFAGIGFGVNPFSTSGLKRFYIGSSTNEMAQELNMNTNAITNLAAPTSGSDAATKSYVDSASNTNPYKFLHFYLDYNGTGYDVLNVVCEGDVIGSSDLTATRDGTGYILVSTSASYEFLRGTVQVTSTNEDNYAGGVYNSTDSYLEIGIHAFSDGSYTDGDCNVSVRIQSV